METVATFHRKTVINGRVRAGKKEIRFYASDSLFCRSWEKRRDITTNENFEKTYLNVSGFSENKSPVTLQRNSLVETKTAAFEIVPKCVFVCLSAAFWWEDNKPPASTRRSSSLALIFSHSASTKTTRLWRVTFYPNHINWNHGQ